jgi:serine/threonine protein kinase
MHRFSEETVKFISA